MGRLPASGACAHRRLAYPRPALRPDPGSPSAGKPPLASDLAMSVSRMRSALSAGVAHPDPELSRVGRGKRNEPWPELPPMAALEAGVPLGVVLHQSVRTALDRSLARGFRTRVRDALPVDPAELPARWYGQQEAPWIAYYDVLHRLGLARYQPDDLDRLGDWAAPGALVRLVVARRRGMRRGRPARTRPHRAIAADVARRGPTPPRWHRLPRRLAPAASVTRPGRQPPIPRSAPGRRPGEPRPGLRAAGRTGQRLPGPGLATRRRSTRWPPYRRVSRRVVAAASSDTMRSTVASP